MKIKFVCNWNSDYNIYNIVNDIWNIDEEYELTYGDDYTHLIIFNKYEPSLIKVPKENVFGFIHEPYWSGFYDKNLPNYCNKVFYWQPEFFSTFNNIIKSTFSCLHHLFPKPIETHELEYVKDNTKNIINTTFIKNKKISIIVSNISHYKRYSFIKDLLKSDIDFDMYGSGWELDDKRYKGRILNKIDALKDYKYSICLENSNINGYISEKFVDSILCGTIPIYNGAPDVLDYYPNSCEYLDLDDNPVDKIKYILNNQKQYNDYSLESAKYLYINKYNPIKIIINNK